MSFYKMSGTTVVSFYVGRTKERPILFSAPVVRAILQGQKTVTRREVKKPAALDCLAAGLEQSFLTLPGNRSGECDRAARAEPW